jgi:hypothetical protein
LGCRPNPSLPLHTADRDRPKDPRSTRALCGRTYRPAARSVRQTIRNFGSCPKSVGDASMNPHELPSPRSSWRGDTWRAAKTGRSTCGF